MYQCNCYIGYTGPKCEVNVDLCANNPCANGQCTQSKFINYSLKINFLLDKILSYKLKYACSGVNEFTIILNFFIQRNETSQLNE
jgi:hypothetical protein